ncbi:MAG: hypothetical protein WAN11_05710 [Syntrophobacteraceae bacterium]
MLNSRQRAKVCRKAFLELLRSKLGSAYIQECKILSNHNSILALYSHFIETNSTWFYDVAEDEWADWNNDGLVFIMSYLDGVSFALLDREESAQLLASVHPETSILLNYLTKWRFLNCIFVDFLAFCWR